MEVKNLKSYLANINMTLKDFCILIECDTKHMSNIMHGKKHPSRRLAKDVRQITDGVVTLSTKPRKPYERRKNNQSQQQLVTA